MPEPPRDRTRYFRIEARELVEAMSRGILELERAPADRGLVAKLLRHAHTLKGAARVVGEVGVGDLAHAAEDALGSHREERAPPVPRERIDELLRIVDAISHAVAALEPAAAAPAPGPESPAAAASDEGFQSVRVDLRDMDALLEAALEAGVQVTALRRQLDRLAHVGELARALSDGLAGRRGEAETPAQGPRLRALVEELRRALEEARRSIGDRADGAAEEVALVRSAADRLRLLPARTVFGPLERAARDAARSLGRSVAFEAAGGDLRVDAHVLAAVRDALVQLVRNAVAHGIEPAAERERAGKPAAGRVRIEVERRGGRVAFTCRDDGRGVDAAAVRAAAARKGLVDAEEAQGLEGDALAALLLRGGLSTSPRVSELAGRGVGLDVVRDAAARLGAEVALRSEPGRGTTVELAVPVSLAALAALRVEAGGVAAALPLDAVRTTLFLEGGRVARGGGGDVVEHEGELVPFVPLARVLGRPESGERRHWAAVIVRAGPRVVALGADRIAGTAELVLRPLPAFVGAHPAIAGAALDGEGNPRLVLDPAGLAAASWEAGPEPEAPRARRPILVIDDSLTTRMLEQSILESAGYEVELAVSAEEALERARARPFGLFLVDVEMPGMDGYEFVRVTRADARLASTPAILVTSRGAPEDRRRGLEAGASAYVVKGEFDQGRLLATIEELLG
jgi:two-component system chemotaxis sensor kinase CheA